MKIVKHSYNLRALLFIISVSCIISCLDPISFSAPEEIIQPLVVSGQFTDNTEMTNEVILSKATRFGLKSLDPVNGAIVKLVSSTEVVSYAQTKDGTYSLPANVLAQPGENYHLEITLSDGAEYRSKDQLMPSSQAPSEIYYEWNIESIFQRDGTVRREPVINLLVDLSIDKLENKSPFFKWQVIEAFSFPEQFCGGLHQPKVCYREFTFPGRVFPILDTRITNQSTIEKLNIGKKVMLRRIEFEGVHFFSAFQQVINQQAFDYWNRVNELLDQEGTVFDKPPASIAGNIYNIDDPQEIVLGFFEVSSVSVSRVKVLPSDFNEQTNTNPLCSPFLRFSWGPECCNCLSIEGTNLQRPSYF